MQRTQALAHRQGFLLPVLRSRLGARHRAGCGPRQHRFGGGHPPCARSPDPARGSVAPAQLGSAGALF